MDNQALTNRVDEAHTKIDGLTGRVSNLETGQAVLGTKLDAIKDTLNKIESHIGWLLKTFLGAVILAFAAYLIKGGLYGN